MNNTYGITIDDSALRRIADLRAAGTPEFPSGALLRVAVEGGGCSGFQYRIEAAKDIAGDDIVFGDAVVIDEVSAQYMKDSTIRFQNDMMSAMFVVDNPNAESNCGCRSSFSLDLSKI